MTAGLSPPLSSRHREGGEQDEDEVAAGGSGSRGPAAPKVAATGMVQGRRELRREVLACVLGLCLVVPAEACLVATTAVAHAHAQGRHLRHRPHQRDRRRRRRTVRRTGLGPAGCQSPPGTTLTLDGTTYQLEGVDTFTKPAATGSFASSDPNQVVYVGDHGMPWTEYPDGWPSTFTGGRIGYQPSTVLSVHDGVLDFYLHDDPQGDPVGSDPSPEPSGNRYQTYGAWSLCERLSGDLADFYQSFLLWPPGDSDYPASESDWPEGPLSGSDFQAFAHNMADYQDQFDSGTLDTTQWHLYTQTWGPGFRSYYVDGKPIGTTTNEVWSGPARWQLQVEPSGQQLGGTGDLYVAWVWIGTWTGAPSGTG